MNASHQFVEFTLTPLAFTASARPRAARLPELLLPSERIVNVHRSNRSPLPTAALTAPPSSRDNRVSGCSPPRLCLPPYRFMESHTPPQHAARGDRVPTREKLTYALAGASETITAGVIGGMTFRIFGMNLMMAPAVIGTVMMFFRLWDAFSDPVMGWISDNFRSRWGRRRPLILVGAILGGCTFWMFWWFPRDLSDTWMVVWMLCTGVLFFTSFTIWAMPYQSMLLEMTPDYHERTRVAQWRAIVQNLAGGIMGWTWWITVQPFFADPVTGEPDAVNGMRWLAIIYGVVFMLLGMLPAFFNKERYYHLVVESKQRVHLIKGLKNTLKNQPFQLLIGISLFFILGTQMVDQLQQYLGLYYVMGNDEQFASLLAALGATIWIVTSVGCVPIYTAISIRIGKRKTFFIAMWMLVLASLSKLVLFNPEYPWLMLGQAVFIGPALAGIWLMIPTMSADIIDEDERVTGERREGSYASVYSNIVKLAFSLGIFAAGWVLTLAGFVPEKESDQAAEVFSRMLWWSALIPAAMTLIAMYFLHRFPITPERAQETREVLEARRGKT